MRSNSILTLILLVLLGSTLSAQTTIINVPSQQSSIAAALAAAQNGDTILVAPGTYNEANINFQGKAVHLRSTGGPQVTIIDALGSQRVMVFNSSETAATIIEGFTIKGGATPDGMDGTATSQNGTDGGDGAGILIQNASPSFVDCIISDHVTGRGGDGFLPGIGLPGSDGGRGGHGAGVFIDGGTPSFSNCLFTNNTTGRGGDGDGTGFPNGTMSTWGGGGQGGDGAAVYVQAGSPAFNNCQFDSNACGRGGDGSGGNGLGSESGPGGRGGQGGACFFLAGSPTVTNCDFTLNQTGRGGDAGSTIGADAQPGGDGGNGGALYSDVAATPTITGSTFSANTCGDGGDGGDSGAFFAVSGNPSIGGFGGSGGALAFTGSPQIDACQFHGNKAGKGGIGGQGFGIVSGSGGFGGSGGALVMNGGVGLVTNCIFADNLAGDGNDAGPSDSAIGGGGAAGVGGAIILVGGGLSISNCTLANNTGGLPGLGAIPGPPSNGGGIFVFGGTMDVSNSIVYGNTAAGTPSNIFDLGAGILVVAHSDVGGGYAGAGNFDADPLFVDAANRDFHLTPASPCRDAGDDNFGFIQMTDFEGDPRIVCGILDVGADEFALMPLSTGQAPRAGLASLDILNATNAYGCGVSTEAPGPYKTNLSSNIQFSFDMEGQPIQPIILLYGNLNPQAATYTSDIGQFDIGSTPDPMTGIPTALTVFGDGTATYLPNNGMATDAAGVASYPYVMPAGMPLGILTTFQAVMFHHPTGLSISNAVEVEIVP